MDTINFTRGVPANESFPTEELVEAAGAVFAQKGSSILQYGPAAGFAPLKEWLANVARRDGRSDPDGQRIAAAHRVSLSPARQAWRCRVHGGAVLRPHPRAAPRHGARVVGIPLQPDGPDIDALARALGKGVPRFFYTIPDFQNPSGGTCSAVKRRQIVELAERHGLLLVEDAPYRLLRYRGKEEPTLYQLAPERTLHMSSFTKLIAPGVRTGFMVGEPGLIAKLAKVAEDTYISPGYVAQGITYEWCRRGLLPPQIERLKMLYAPRLDACLHAIDQYMPDATATRPDGGFFISLTLPEGVVTTKVREIAAKRGLNLADGLAFFPEGGGERFLRLPFCALTPAEIDDGVRRLSESVAEARQIGVA